MLICTRNGDIIEINLTHKYEPLELSMKRNTDEPSQGKSSDPDYVKSINKLVEKSNALEEQSNEEGSD